MALNSKSSFRTVALAAAKILDGKKAEDILILHPGPSNPVADYLVIAGAMSPAHMEALETEVVKTIRDSGIPCVHRARPRSDSWRILDFGGLLVHIMTAEAREFYALEKLHAGARRIKFEPPRAKSAAA